MPEALDELNQAFGPDILMRTASWLTFKESRASFLIEKEADQADRIQRFAHVIAQYCGHIENPLSNDSLQSLQVAFWGVTPSDWACGALLCLWGR